MRKQVPLRLEEADYKELKKILIDIDMSFQELVENMIKEFLRGKRGDNNE